MFPEIRKALFYQVIRHYFSVIALTTLTCIVSASFTKGVLVCFVVTMHRWRRRTHYDVTEAYRALRNILIFIWTMQQHTRTWEESPNNAKWRRKQGVNRQVWCVILMRFSFINGYGINPYSYSGQGGGGGGGGLFLTWLMFWIMSSQIMFKFLTQIKNQT